MGYYLFMYLVFTCSIALCPVMQFCTILIFIKLLSTNYPKEAGNTSPWSGSYCLLRSPDCLRHAEYACGLDCCEKMGMNNKDAVMIQEHSISVLLSPHPPRTNKENC